MKTLIFIFFVLAYGNSNAQWVKYDSTSDKQWVQSISSLNTLSNGKVIVAYLDQLVQFNQSKKLWDNIVAIPDTFPSTALINSIAKDKNDNFWLATTDGLKYFDYQQGKMAKRFSGTLWTADTTGSLDQFTNLVSQLALDSNNGVWLYGWSNAIALIHYKDGIFEKHWTPPDTVNYYYLPAMSGSSSMEVEKNGCVWYHSYGGLVCYNPTKEDWKLYDLSKITNDTNHLSPTKIFIAKNGIIWVNAEPYHIISFNPADSAWTVYNQTDIPNVRTDDASISLSCPTFAEDKNGNIWATMGPDYLAKFDVKTKKWSKMQLPDGRYASQGVKNFVNYGLTVDNNGYVWVGTRGEGVEVYMGEADGVAEQKTQITTLGSALPTVWIFSVAPNPVKVRTNISFYCDPSLYGGFKLKLYDLLGSVVRDVTPSVQYDNASALGTASFSVEDIQIGVYLLVASNGGETRTEMIAITK